MQSPYSRLDVRREACQCAEGGFEAPLYTKDERAFRSYVCVIPPHITTAADL